MTIPILHIVDTSSNNGPVDLALLQQQGVEGVLIKLGEYTNYRNPYFDGQWADAKRLGMWRGAYFFARSEYGNPAAQSAFYLSQLPPLDTYDGTAFDIETGTGPQSEFALTWLSRVEAATGFPPLVYSYEQYILDSLADPRLGHYPLWLAALGSLPPTIGPWTSVALWQYTWSAHFAGVAGNVDESELARDRAGLNALGKPPTPATIITRCGLKPQANHTCPTGTYLPAGTTVGAVSTPVQSDDTWQYVVAGANAGYVLARNLRAA